MMLQPENQNNAQQIQGVHYPKETYFFFSRSQHEMTQCNVRDLLRLHVGDMITVVFIYSSKLKELL